MGKEHAVPLSEQAVAILRAQEAERDRVCVRRSATASVVRHGDVSAVEADEGPGDRSRMRSSTRSWMADKAVPLNWPSVPRPRGRQRSRASLSAVEHAGAPSPDHASLGGFPVRANRRQDCIHRFAAEAAMMEKPWSDRTRFFSALALVAAIVFVVWAMRPQSPRVIQCDVTIHEELTATAKDGGQISMLYTETAPATIEFVEDHRALYKSKGTKPMVVFDVTAGNTAYVFSDRARALQPYYFTSGEEKSFSMSIDRTTGVLNGDTAFDIFNGIPALAKSITLRENVKGLCEFDLHCAGD